MLAIVGDLMLDIEEVAERLKVSESTIRSLVRSGKLRAYRIGGKRGRLRFKEEDLDAYVDSTLVQPADIGNEEDKSASEDAYRDMKEHAPNLGEK
jgi:excisionase family DNA binding protein